MLEPLTFMCRKIYFDVGEKKKINYVVASLNFKYREV